MDRSTSGKSLAGSISMLLTVGSLATLTVVRFLPSNQTLTGTSRVSVLPSVRVTARCTGIGALPRLETITSSESPTVVTVSMAWSSFQVSKNQVRQNQERSWPETSSKVSKKSYGVGCLYIQRRPYSVKARWNSSRPSTPRSATSTLAVL